MQGVRRQQHRVRNFRILKDRISIDLHLLEAEFLRTVPGFSAASGSDGFQHTGFTAAFFQNGEKGCIGIIAGAQHADSGLRSGSIRLQIDPAHRNGMILRNSGLVRIFQKDAQERFILFSGDQLIGFFPVFDRDAMGDE